ncbi:hypothetical protein [Brevundimonas sp. NIBR11]|nr:hypothetical protein [Brevundimonas sp. NIBR11]WGM32175.1 hypothetical protein KKHFBJBL_02426 [Brevundimonas sp. NIBR11]
MVVKQFRGRGRRAVTATQSKPGGWLFRLFMAWFSNGIAKR